MTPYEIARILALPVLPVIHGRVHRELRRLLGKAPRDRWPALLDVGGRSSPYTAGLAARVTVLDLPRQGEVRERLQLGLTDQILERLSRRRSNIERVVLEDMTRCSLPDGSFDGVVAVETIEHVPEDDAFIRQIERVLKPGGWAYFTTPNGDYVKNDPPHHNPDHVRHYTRAELTALLERHFPHVAVVYGVKTGKHRYRGLRSFLLRRPLRLLVGMISNLISRWESRGLDEQPHRTAHLFAEVRKAAP